MNVMKMLEAMMAARAAVVRRTNPAHPRRERRELGISPRQQRRAIRKVRRHNLLFNREVY